jgi:hypothetical protein
MRLALLALAALALTGCVGLKWAVGYNPQTKQWTVSGELPPPGNNKK